ncbi:hypothetical protein [Ottowia sp.]|uniref:hypothetical protein n=1 Tax=Ottowia sp. TaxID=1898956 RepID=UPI00263824A6|nr:hypothetical protein [Ottowia sp.]
MTQTPGNHLCFHMLHDQEQHRVTYLLADLQAREAVLVDPHASDLPVLRAMLDEHRVGLRWLLRTHEHDDVMPGEHKALARMDVPIIQHRVPEPASRLDFGREAIQVMATPGHTDHCLSFLWRDRLFCGDLLSLQGCGWRTDPQCPEAMWNSVVNKVFRLPSETLLFASHGEPGRIVSSVYEQRRSHPWFASASRDQFLAAVPWAALPSFS